MRTGLLNKVISIYRPEMTKNEFGEKIQTYNEHYKARARVIYTGGSRSEENKEIIYPYTVSFEVWKHVDVDEKDFIHFNGKKYRILNITEDDAQNKKVISTELVNE